MSENTTIVIFGASGDLTQRKVVPALFSLYFKGRLPADTRIVGFAPLRSARAWLEQTCDVFPLLLDPEPEVYRTYGLQES